MDLDGREREEELRGAGGGKIMIKNILCEKQLFLTKEKFQLMQFSLMPFK